MSEFRKTFPGELYFATLTVVGWIDLFTRSELADIILDNLMYCQEKKFLNIYSYVLMPSHLHLIASGGNGTSLNKILGSFKSFTSKELLNRINESPKESRREWLIYLFRYFGKLKRQYTENHLWQGTNHPTVLDSAEIIDQKMDYIHNNPVRANIVTEPEHYLYSSAHPCSPIKVLPL